MPSLGKKLRFEVFKRDSFTCQYCGRKAPDVLLEVDHIEPSSLGGSDEIINLITSCKDCNSGKSNRPLSDDSAIQKQHQQLAELQERREQIEMMFEWRKGLDGIQDEILKKLTDYWCEMVPGFGLNSLGISQFRNLMRRFSIDEILAAMRIATDQYLEVDEHGGTTIDSVNLAWSKVPAICRVRKSSGGDPDVGRLFYIRGILRKRFCYVNDWKAMDLLKDALKYSNIEELETISKRARNWTQWHSEIEELIKFRSAPDPGIASASN